MVGLVNMVDNKYKYFTLRTLLLFLASLIVQSCGLFSDSLVLSEDQLKPDRSTKIDSISEKAVFYFGLISDRGLDRFEQDVFQELFFDVSAKKNTIYPEHQLTRIKRRLERKPFRLIYVLDAYLSDTTEIAESQMKSLIEQKKNRTLTLLKSVPNDSIANFNEEEKTEEIKVLSSLIELKEKASAKEDKRFKKYEGSVVTIVSCTLSSVGDPQRQVSYLEDISGLKIGYYTSGKWNRFFVAQEVDQSEIREIFPDSWPSRYGQ